MNCFLSRFLTLEVINPAAEMRFIKEADKKKTKKGERDGK